MYFFCAIIYPVFYPKTNSNSKDYFILKKMVHKHTVQNTQYKKKIQYCQKIQGTNSQTGCFIKQHMKEKQNTFIGKNTLHFLVDNFD